MKRKEVKIETGTGMQICRYGKMQVLVGPATRQIKDGLRAAGARPLRGLFPEKFNPAIPDSWIKEIGYTNKDGITKVFCWRIDASKADKDAINELIASFKPSEEVPVSAPEKKKPGRPRKKVVSNNDTTKKATPEVGALIRAIEIARKYKSWDSIPAKELARIANLCEQAGINVRVIRAAI